jgi:hypothetical protein
LEKVDPNAAADSADLMERYVKPFLRYQGNPLGALQVAGALGHSLGAQSLAGWKGISDSLRGRTPTVESDAEAFGPHSLGASGIQAIKDIAPIYRGVTEGPLGAATHHLGEMYSQGVSTDADLVGKYLGQTAGGLTQAAGAVAPMLAGPGEGKAVEEAATHVPGYFDPLLADGAHAGTLEREAAANARRAEDGLPVGEAPPSEFQGRQAEHEGAVAQRMNEKVPSQITAVPGPESHLADSVPDNATVYTATHPETGEIQGHMVAIPRGGAIQSAGIEVNPKYQRQGIGRNLFNSGVSDAHAQGVPFSSDTSVTPAHMANAQHSGHSIVFNPHIEEGSGPYGPALVSSNGQPVFSIPPPTPADTALVNEPEHGSWITNQGGEAFADGGEVGTALGGLGDLIKQYAPLKGMPSRATIPGAGTIDVGPHQPARDAATAYMKAAGLPYHPPSQYAQVDPAKAKQIAAAFDAMPHAPDDPKVKASYDAMIRETLAQYQHMKNTGLNVEFMPPGEDPYAASPRLAAQDVKNNNHLYVYPTSSGFGSGDDAAAVSGNHLLGDSGESFGGVPATNNDVFRAVHDYFGHVKEGVGFRANGEENAWRQHAAMYSPEALPAMTSETRGQNSWLNYGPHGDTNRTAKTADTVFAPQKTGILPDEYNSLDDPELHFLHMSNLSTPTATLDPSFYGTGIKGAEAKRGGTKVTSLYPADIPVSDIEHGLESKTPYRVSVPASSMYDLNIDPQNFRDTHQDFSDVEDAIKDAGYAGYHVPQGQGIFKGQGRLFQSTPATRLGPGPAVGPEEDMSAGFAEGGEVGTALGGLSDLVAKYAPKQTDTPAFKQWFGKSQVVDPSGAPRKLYHSTFAPEDFSVFKPGPDEFGVAHFGTSDQANERLSHAMMQRVLGKTPSSPRLIPAYLKAENPFRMADLGDWTPEALYGELNTAGISPDSANIPTTQEMIQHLKNAGHDSIVYRNMYERKPGETPSDSYIVFDPSQIKSSIGSNFDPGNPDFTMANGGSVRGFADGGSTEAGALLGGLGDLVAKYAPEAEHLASTVADKGDVTYNPTSGDIHSTGYAVPTQPHRSVALDTAPAPDDIHNFLLEHQDAFDEDPQAALHVHSDDNGNHFMHVAHVTPDFGHASDVAHQAGVPGFMDLSSGDVHPASTGARDLPETAANQDDQSLVDKYLSGAPRLSTPWTPGRQTVANPQRNAFPGIYNDPRQVIADASEKVGPEDPLMQQLFGVSRGDLSDLSLSRQGNELGSLPGASANPRGAESALGVMTPANEQRLIDVLGEARNSPDLYKGMTGWYAMDPLYQRFQQMYGDEEAPGRFEKFITLMGMASPGSNVHTEIARGTAAHWLDNQGRFEDFLKYGGGKEAATGAQKVGTPEDMLAVPGHAYHRTAQGLPMADYLGTGKVQMNSPKVPPYIRASGVPETGFQTDLPVGDAHWSRGVGLADTRNQTSSKGVPTVPNASVSTPEMQTLQPWWKNRVAGQAGLESVPAQALLWGAMSPYTGVTSAIGAPKLEILSSQIGKAAQRLGVSPETARDLIISGKTGAFAEGGIVRDVLDAGGI